MMENMNRTAKVILGAAAVYLALFLTAAPFDYPFSEFLTSHANVWLVTFGARLGPLPATMISGYCILALGSLREKWRLYRVAAIAIIAAGAFNVLKPDLSSMLDIGFLIVLWAVMFFLVRQVPVPGNTSLNEHILQYSVLVILISNTVVQFMKLLWGRPRFYALKLYDLTFVPWHRIAGFAMRPDAFRSFPSGHTVTAASMFLLVFLPVLYPERFHSRTKLWVLCGIYTALIASTRIMAGMHFLTDVLAGCAVFLLTMLVVTFVFRKLGIDIWSESAEEETKSNEQPENKSTGMDEGKIRNG